MEGTVMIRRMIERIESVPCWVCGHIARIPSLILWSASVAILFALYHYCPPWILVISSFLLLMTLCFIEVWKRMPDHAHVPYKLDGRLGKPFENEPFFATGGGLGDGGGAPYMTPD